MSTLPSYKLPKYVQFECVHGRLLLLVSARKYLQIQNFSFDLNVISRAQFTVAFYPVMKRQQPRNVWNFI